MIKIVFHSGDKQKCLRAFYDALDFPGWFGFNWDALWDCLTDLSWLQTPLEIRVETSHSALSDPKDQAIFEEILRDAVPKLSPYHIQLNVIYL